MQQVERRRCCSLTVVGLRVGRGESSFQLLDYALVARRLISSLSIQLLINQRLELRPGQGPLNDVTKVFFVTSAGPDDEGWCGANVVQFGLRKIGLDDALVVSCSCRPEGRGVEIYVSAFR